MANVCVIGLGYVGLTLATALATKGHNVLGIESSRSSRELIGAGVPPFFEEGLEQELKKCLASGNFKLGDKIDNRLTTCKFFVISIGSPISTDKSVNLDKFLDLARTLADYLTDESVVILRSTVPVGTTRNLFSYFKGLGLNVHVNFCPERTVEGAALRELFTLPQVVSSVDPTGLQAVEELFLSITNETVPVSSVEAAELVKLISNMWRDFTFSFSNELFNMVSHTNINLLEVIEAANYNYPRNIIPSPGAVGGPCLTKDTHIFSQSINSKDHIFNEARTVNENFPESMVKRIQSKFKIEGNIGILGWSFKGNPPTSDLRQSPTYEYLRLLKEIQGVSKVFGWNPDPLDPQINDSNFFFSLDLEDLIDRCNTVFLANNHPFFKSKEFAEILENSKNKKLIFDLWNSLKKYQFKTHEIVNIGVL